MEEKLKELADKMNEVFPHLGAVVDDGAITFEADIVDNGGDKKFPKAISIYLFPHYQNDPIYETETDKAEVFADIAEVSDGPMGPYYQSSSTGEIQEVYPIQKYMINPECVCW